MNRNISETDEKQLFTSRTSLPTSLSFNIKGEIENSREEKSKEVHDQ